eukprot:scaffold29913_cov81-Phaeocystis_antarctica.AAC.1
MAWVAPQDRMRERSQLGASCPPCNISGGKKDGGPVVSQGASMISQAFVVSVVLWNSHRHKDTRTLPYSMCRGCAQGGVWWKRGGGRAGARQGRTAQNSGLVCSSSPQHWSQGDETSDMGMLANRKT